MQSKKKHFKNGFYFGNNYKIAQTIDRRIVLTTVVCERRFFNQDIFNFTKIHEMVFHLVESVNELEAIVPEGLQDSIAFSYGGDIIFPPVIINRFTHGIWNIHTGELPENRGRHPISWNFLNGCWEFGICIHRVDTRIDMGWLLAEGSVSRDLTDNQWDIIGKMENLLESSLLDMAIDNFRNNNIVKLHDGTYNKNLINAFDHFSPDKFDSVFTFNLFKSQEKFGGLNIKGKQYIECRFYHEEFPHLYDGWDVYMCKDNQKVALR